jgi:hypothetical protein
MMANNPKSVTYETDPRTGYVVRTTVERRPDGGENKFRTLLVPEQLIKDAMQDELSKLGGAPDTDRQEIMRQVAMRLQIDASTKGHQEVLDWLVQYADRVLATSADLQGKKHYPMTEDPKAAQYEGVADAIPGTERRAFMAIKKAIDASVQRMGEHESGNPEDQKGWSRLAKRKARLAQAKTTKEFVPLDEEAPYQSKIESRELIGIDLVALAADLKRLFPKGRDRDVWTYIRFCTEATRAKMPQLLTKLTGEKWDSKRVDRARKRFEYRRPEIKAAAAKHLTLWQGTQNVVKLKTARNPSGEGAWVHAFLLRLFLD